MLFFERCLDWLAPGGKLGIVMPKSFLDTQTYYPVRKLLLEKFKLLAVVNCHKDTFQPHTGVRTCLIFVQKPETDEIIEDDYKVFMAISKKIGQDSEGFPIFKRDKDNHITDVIDHDLDIIYSDYLCFTKDKLKESEYRFCIQKSEIDSLLRINPQVYLPNLNETIRRIESIDGKAGWSVTTLGQIESNIRIFKGPRLKSENLIVDKIGKNIEPYYTPSAVLQEKGESVKLLNISYATRNQLNTIDAVRVYTGDIVVTRSGTIGRAAYITQRLNGAIVSDDLIRVRIKDERLRMYVYAFLQSKAALDQMERNEYGAVQQHLEPTHIANIMIPIPEDWNAVKELIDNTINYIQLKENLDISNKELGKSTEDLLKVLQIIQVKE
jgi:type I restriction enzyme M protein